MFQRLNNTLIQAGDAITTDPPVQPPPLAVATLTGTFDIGTGNFEVAFTPTPLDGDDRLMIWVAVVDGSGISYVENLYKLVTITGKGATSPIDIEATTIARFGTLQVGQQVYVKVQVLDSVTGLKSGFVATNGVIVST